MLAVVGCACLFAQTCMLHFSAKHHRVSARALISALDLVRGRVRRLNMTQLFVATWHSCCPVS